ncbi:MAG: GumC family protein [Phormidesmis sp.]
MTDVLAKIKPQKPSRQLALPGFNYLFLGVILNAIVWGGTLLYLRKAAPTYASTWGVIVLGEDANVDVSLPDSGRASTTGGGSRAQAFEDPRSDYLYIATSASVLEEAANQVGSESDEFGDPDITTDEDSAIMSFVIEGDTPDLAQRKSRALYVVLNQHIEQLRQNELARREQENQVTLEEARLRVETAQDELAQYQATSAFGSDQQLQGLATGIEELRRLRSEYSAQAEGLGGRIAQLNSDVDFESQDVSDAYSLQSDPVYQQQFTEYGRLSAEFSDVSSQLGAQHPQVVAKRAELQGAQAAVQQRGSFLLGRPVNQETLTRIAPLGLDPQVGVVRGELFRESVVNQADREGLISQNQTLASEINQMESRFNELSQEKFTIDRLRRNLQVAETIFASTLAKLDLNKNDIYSIYPPIQLVTEPTLPDENDPVSPNKKMIFLAGLAGSFVVTFGLLLLWYENREPRNQTQQVDKQLPSWLSS